MDEIILAVAVFFLFLQFAGYIYLLRIMAWLKPVLSPDPLLKSSYPKILILLPVYQEEKLVAQKLLNLNDLEYPGKKRVLVIDGGSSDQTLQEIARVTPSLTSCKMEIYHAQGGKIPQLNLGLSHILDEELILITDCDAMISTKHALCYVAAFFNSPNLGVVGGWTAPGGENVLPAETAYWDKENRLRYLESRCFSTSIVTAPFYCFRKSLLNTFPSDCVADDVFVSFCAHKNRLRAIYAPEIEVTEVRQAGDYISLFFLKLRRGNAYLRELLRRVPDLSTMGLRSRVFLLFKLFQFLLLPWSSLLFAIGCVLAAKANHWFLVVMLTGLTGIAVVIASLLVIPPPGKKRGGFRWISIHASVLNFALINLAMVLGVLAYPFWSQNSSYKKANT